MTKEETRKLLSAVHSDPAKHGPKHVVETSYVF